MAGYEISLDIKRTFAQPTSSQSVVPSNMDSCLSLAFAANKPSPMSPHQAIGGNDCCSYIDASALSVHQGRKMRRYSSEDSNHQQQQFRSEWVTLSKTMLMMLVERICQMSFDNDGKNMPSTTTMSEGGNNDIVIITRETKDDCSNSSLQQLQQLPKERRQESGQQEPTAPHELRQELNQEFQEIIQNVTANKQYLTVPMESCQTDSNPRSTVPYASCDETLSSGTAACVQESEISEDTDLSKHYQTLSSRGNHIDSLEPYDSLELRESRESTVSDRRKRSLKPFKSTAKKCRRKKKKSSLMPSFSCPLNCSIQPWMALNKSIVYRMFDSVLNSTASQCQESSQTTSSHCQVQSQTTASQCHVPSQTPALHCQLPSQTTASQWQVSSQTTASHCQVPLQTTALECKVPSQTSAPHRQKAAFTTLGDRYFFCYDQIPRQIPVEKSTEEERTSRNCWKSGESLEQPQVPPPNPQDAICEAPILGALLCCDDVTFSRNDVTSRNKLNFCHRPSRHRSEIVYSEKKAFVADAVFCRSSGVRWTSRTAEGSPPRTAAVCSGSETIDNRLKPSCSRPQSMPIDYSNNSNEIYHNKRMTRSTFDGGRPDTKRRLLESKGVLPGGGRRPRWIAIDKDEMYFLVESLLSTMMSEDDVSARWRDVRLLSNDECGVSNNNVEDYQPLRKENDSKCRYHGSGRHDDDRLEDVVDVDCHLPGVVASSKPRGLLVLQDAPGERGRKQKRPEEYRKTIFDDENVVPCHMKWKSDMLRRLHSQALQGNDRRKISAAAETEDEKEEEISKEEKEK